MSDKQKTLVELIAATPIPTILVIFGFLTLILSFVVIKGQVETIEEGRPILAGIGGILVATGILLYLKPSTPWVWSLPFVVGVLLFLAVRNLTGTPTSLPTDAPTSTIVAAITSDTPTATPVVPTSTPVSTSTTPTHTPIPPTTTNTPLPTVTNTPEPSATNTPLPPTNTPMPPPTNTPVSSAPTSPSVELLGLWEYQGSRPPMPNPASSGQVILANGDIDNSGTCHIKVFYPGEQVQALGEGTFQLWLISGTTEQIEAAITNTQEGSARDAGGSCPRLPSTSPSAVKVDFLGLWEYQGSRPPMPNPAGQDQVILANGDIDNSGTCHIKVFGPGEPVQGLGEGTFELRLVSGTTEQIETVVTKTQEGSARGAGGSCPRLP